ncbi:MAG TPA: NAD-dependent epimerase/dehydratase family protein [Ktedonobacteraceae bacterium]
MTIFLAGATGFIGGHILHALSTQGYEVTCLVRPASLHGGAACSQLDALPGVRVVAGEWTRPQTWLYTVAGHKVVINAVGIIRESRQTSFSQVHTAAPCALFEAASKGGVNKIVQISALGADEQACSGFHLTKRAADQYLEQLGVPYVILRPSFVYGPGDHSMAFFSRLARLPVTPVPGDGCYRVQPLHVQDLVRAVVLAVERPDLSAVVADIGGGEVLTFNEMLDLLARKPGKSHGARRVHIPWRLMSLVALATDLLAGHGPITTDELNMLKRENITSHPAQFVDLFGFEPLPFSIGVTERS